MPRKSDHSDDEVADTERAFRLYMQKLFPGMPNLEAKLDEMDAIDAIIDNEQTTRKGRKVRRVPATIKGKRSPTQKKRALSMVDEEPEESEDDASSDTEMSGSDDDDGQLQLNVIFAVGAPLEEDDEDDSEWMEETDDGDTEDEDAAMEFLAMLNEQAQHHYNTRSKSRSTNRVVGKQEAVLDSGASDSESSVKEGEALDTADDLVAFFLENGEDAFREKFAQEVSRRKTKVAEDLARKKQKESRAERKKNTVVFKKAIRKKKTASSLAHFTKLEPHVQRDIIRRLEEVNADMHSSQPPKIALLQSDIPVEYKTHAMRKLNTLSNMDPSSGEYYKVKQWVDGFMRLPFGRRSDMPVTMGVSEPSQIANFMEQARKQLDGVTYGMEEAKSQIMQLVGQWVANPSSNGTAIGIKGPMGTGKTTLVKHGVSKILERPFAFITLGGATDSSYLEGHSYTYEGSVWGQIATILMQSKSMNPVIYFDELDKVSDTAKGQEIIGILTHLTDTTQNSEYHDKYFAGINFDLSGALFIFSYNDENLVNPILRDRMHVIETKGYNAEDKRAIARQFLIPEVETTISFEKGAVTMEDDVLDHITRTYTSGEKGVRNLKRCLENIYAKLNVSRLSGSNASVLKSSDMLEFVTPFSVTREIVDKLLTTPKRDIPANMYC